VSAATLKIDLGEGIWAEVVEDKRNELVKRRELTLRIHHELQPTPPRITVRMAVASALGVGIEVVYVRRIKTEYGIGQSIAEVHVYDSKERALEFEPEYLIERNGGVNPFEE